MTLALAIVVALFVLASIAGTVGYSLWAGAQRRRAWDAQFLAVANWSAGEEPTPSWYSWRGTWYSWRGTAFAPQRTALYDALTALVMHGPWPEAEVDRALADLHLVVHTTPSWTDGFGRQVAGLADCGSFTYPVVSVGSDFASLAHELVEVMLQKNPTAVLDVTSVHPDNRPDNWWTSTGWGEAVLAEYEKRRQTDRKPR